jgi:hypothetical protein
MWIHVCVHHTKVHDKSHLYTSIYAQYVHYTYNIHYVHHLCLIGRVYLFYVGHVDRVVYMKPFSTVIL